MSTLRALATASITCGLAAATSLHHEAGGIIISDDSAAPLSLAVPPEAEVHDTIVALRLTQASLRDLNDEAEETGLGHQIDGLEAEEASELKGRSGDHTVPEDCDEIEARLHALEQRYYQKLAEQQAYKTVQHKQQLDQLRSRIDSAQRQLEQLKAFGSGASAQPIEIDTKIVPYPGAVEQFGTQDTAQAMTHSSVQESNAMVDSIEKAQKTEGKRAVYRALTHLRAQPSPRMTVSLPPT